MTFLPIVERELRVTARKSGVHWVRFFTALAMIVLWTIFILGSTRSSMRSSVGHHIFNFLGMIGFGLALFSGVFLTAGCITEEKSEGTLGLLFLTDLKGYDVVLGKLVSTSLVAVYGLLALLPILGLPLLQGGVTGGEFWRLMLVLLLTTFFSLSLGLVMSTLARETRQATVATVLVLLFFAGGPPILWWLLKSLFNLRALNELLLWPSPAFGYFSAFDSYYHGRGLEINYWASGGTMLLLGIFFIRKAAQTLPNVWRLTGESDTSNRRQIFWRRLRYGAGVQWSRVFIAKNHLEWLMSRDRLPQVLIGMAFIVLVPVWICFLFASGAGVAPYRIPAFITCFAIAYGMHQVLKFMMIFEAGRRFCEDKNSGALELLLVSGVKLRSLIQAQRSSLQRRFGRAALVLVIVNVGLCLFTIGFGRKVDISGNDLRYFLELFIGGLIALPLDLAAICHVGMLKALQSSRHSRGMLGTIATVMLPGWLGLLFVFFLGMINVPIRSPEPIFITWFTFVYLSSIVTAGRAKHKLKVIASREINEEAGMLPRSFGPLPNLTGAYAETANK